MSRSLSCSYLYFKKTPAFLQTPAGAVPPESCYSFSRVMLNASHYSISEHFALRKYLFSLPRLKNPWGTTAFPEFSGKKLAFSYCVPVAFLV